MIIAWIPLLFAVAGLLIYGLSEKHKGIGRDMFVVGSLVFLLLVSGVWTTRVG